MDERVRLDHSVVVPLSSCQVQVVQALVLLCVVVVEHKVVVVLHSEISPSGSAASSKSL